MQNKMRFCVIKFLVVCCRVRFNGFLLFFPLHKKNPVSFSLCAFFPNLSLFRKFTYWKKERGKNET